MANANGPRLSSQDPNYKTDGDCSAPLPVLSQCYGPSTGALDVANALAERGGFEPPEP